MLASNSLSSSARLAFVGLLYIYLVKFIDTLWHGIFAGAAISFSVVGLNILAGFAQCLFFYKLKDATSADGLLYSVAGWAGIWGALINMLPKGLALSVLLQYYFSIALTKHSQVIAVLSPLLGAIMLLGCCSLFFFLSAKNRGRTTRAFLLGSIGYFILTVNFSVLVINYFSGSQLDWQVGEIGTSFTYFIISASLSFFCIAFFYAGFFHPDDSIETI